MFKALMAIGLSVVPTCAQTSTSSVVMKQVGTRVPTTYIVGASVTRLSVGYIRTRLPGAVINAVDARSMVHPDKLGGPTVMQVIRGWLPTLKPGDWVVVEAAHGGVDVETNRRYMREALRLLGLKHACVAWVLPATYYTTRTPTTIEWNRATNEMIYEEIEDFACHALVDWGPTVEGRWLTPEGRPLVYDGRHPTKGGQWWYAKLMYDAIQNPIQPL